MVQKLNKTKKGTPKAEDVAALAKNTRKTAKTAEEDPVSESHPIPRKKLNRRQIAFVEEMAKPKPKSATQAAKDAGYSPKTAGVIATEILQKPYILEAIEKRKAEVAKFANITPETVLGAAVRQATSSIDDCYNAKGYFDIKKARRTGAIHLIKAIRRTPNKYGESVTIEMYAADEARREIAEYLGMKQMPRENEQKLKRTIQAIRDYMQDFPEADIDRVAEVFSRGRGVPKEQILEHLEMVQ